MVCNKLIKEEEFSGKNQDLHNMKRRLERELSRVNQDLSEKLSKNRDLRNIIRKYEAMEVLGVHKIPVINEICTERTMQVLEVSAGHVQPSGFWRNQEIIFGSGKASNETLEVFRRIEDSQEEKNADEPVSDSNMSTGSAKTSCLDRDSACTWATMSEDWLVVPDHGRGLSDTREYDYDWAGSTKAVPRNFVEALNLSTTSADGELVHGGNNARSMSVQNMDIRQVTLSHHDLGIENDHFYVISVPKLVVDQVTDVQVHWNLIVPVSAATWMPGPLLLMVHMISILKLAGCNDLGLIPYLNDYEVMDSNPEIDKLAECEVIGSNYERDTYFVLSSNP